MAPATKALHEALLRALKMAVSAYETWLKQQLSLSNGEGQPSRDPRKVAARL